MRWGDEQSAIECLANGTARSDWKLREPTELCQVILSPAGEALSEVITVETRDLVLYADRPLIITGTRKDQKVDLSFTGQGSGTRARLYAEIAGLLAIPPSSGGTFS